MTSDEPGTPSNSRADFPEGHEKVRVRIFFDADILIGQSDAERELQNRMLFSLFFSSKRIELLTTEITRIQVAKNRAEQACNELRALSSEKFARLASELFSIDLPTMDKGGMHETAYNYYLEKITNETSESNWRCVEYIDDVVQKVFTEYGKKKGFFRDGAKRANSPMQLFSRCSEQRQHMRHRSLYSHVTKTLAQWMNTMITSSMSNHGVH